MSEMQLYLPGFCCRGINESHEGDCQAFSQQMPYPRRLVCWCCGGTYPSHWACLWSQNGSRCFRCEDDAAPGCRKRVDKPLENLVYDAL